MADQLRGTGYNLAVSEKHSVLVDYQFLEKAAPSAYLTTRSSSCPPEICCKLILLGKKLPDCEKIAFTMNSVVEQRMLIDHERRCIIQNPGLSALGGCERHPQQAEDSVFMTPKSSPAYSTDGNAYPSDMGYFASAQPSPTSMGQCMEPPGPHPLVSTSSGFMGPASPCDEYGSPYSPPYDNSSPHSIACSASPHGSPASIACSDGQYTPYLSPSPSIHDIPSSSLPMTSLPYSVDSGPLIYTSVPITTAGYYSSMTQAHWMNGNELPSFDAFPQGEHPQLSFEGEIPVAVIDMQIPRDGAHIEAEMNTQLNFYSSPCSSPNRQHPVYYDMPQMVHPELAPSAVCPPVYTNKPTKATQKSKRPPKPAVQVNDEYIKDIPTSAQLWEFTLRVLKKPSYNYMINWENRKEGLFRFHDAPAFAALWGKHRNRPNMTYDKVARALRYYYKRDILNQVGGRLTYRFSKRLGKLYAADD